MMALSGRSLCLRPDSDEGHSAYVIDEAINRITDVSFRQSVIARPDPLHFLMDKHEAMFGWSDKYRHYIGETVTACHRCA